MRAKPVRVIKQRNDMDCGVAALAMLLHKPYGDVSLVVRRLVPVIPRRGLAAYHLQEIAATHFGVSLCRVYKSRDYLLGQPTGILGVTPASNKSGIGWCGHWVMLKEGVVLDPNDGFVYGLKEYLRKNKAKPAMLLLEE